MAGSLLSIFRSRGAIAFQWLIVKKESIVRKSSQSPQQHQDAEVRERWLSLLESLCELHRSSRHFWKLDGVPDLVGNGAIVDIEMDMCREKTAPNKKGKVPSLRTVNRAVFSFLHYLEIAWSRNLVECVKNGPAAKPAEKVARDVVIRLQRLVEQFDDLPCE